MEPFDLKNVIKRQRPLTSSSVIRKRTTDLVSSPVDFVLDTHKLINNNNNLNASLIPSAPTKDNNRTKKIISPRVNVHSSGKGNTWDGGAPSNNDPQSNTVEFQTKVDIHITKIKKEISPKRGRADTAPTPSSFCENSDFEDPSVVNSKSDNEISTILFPVKPMENISNIQGIKLSSELSRRSIISKSAAAQTLTARINMNIQNSRPPQILLNSEGRSHSPRDNTFINNDKSVIQSTVRPTFNKNDCLQKLGQKVTIEELLNYFVAAEQEPNSTNASYLHVTSRYNLETVLKPNFYDIVILEKPGQNSSGFTWNKHGVKDQKVLKGCQLMQLSFEGLLVTNNDGSDGEMIPLARFFKERSILAKLKKLLFFGLFIEYKIFISWRNLIRSSKYIRCKKSLFESSYLLYKPLVTAQLIVINAAYTIENNVELFYFHGNGSIDIIEFLKQQINCIIEVTKDVKTRILKLGDELADQFDDIIKNRYLENKVQEHPLHHRQNKHKVIHDINWTEVRSLNRVRDDCKHKLENIMYMSQYAIDIAITKVLSKFWSRFKKIVAGILEIESGKSNVWRINSNIYKPNDNKISKNGNNDENKNYVVDDVYNLDYFDSKFVDKEWINKGSHISMYLSLCDDKNEEVNMKYFSTLSNTDKFKVKIQPSKKNVLDLLQKLFGTLAFFLESLPNLREHSFISVDRRKIPDVKVFDSSNSIKSGSSFFFTRLHLYPILNSNGCLKDATNSMDIIKNAYNDATSYQGHIIKLQQCYRSLLNIKPDSLTKQIDRSMLLPKVREIMDRANSLDDINRVVLRDKGRLSALEKAVKILFSISNTLESFKFVKNDLGFILLFDNVLRQLSDLRDIQTNLLFRKLPTSFSSRCINFIEFMNTLVSKVDLQNADFNGLLQLLRNLKNFETANELFILECNICESIYNIIDKHNKINDTTTNIDKVQSMQVLPTSIPRKESKSISKQTSKNNANQIDPSSLFKMFKDTKNSLFEQILKGKSLLLGQVLQIKKDILSKRNDIHIFINKELVILQQPSFSDSKEVPSIVVHELLQSNKKITKLKDEVNEMMQLQYLLLEAHDIIGSADPILSIVDVDYFKDMSDLEATYLKHFKIWNSILTINKMDQMIMTSKLAQLNVKLLYSQYKLIAALFKALISTNIRLKNAAILLLSSKIDYIKPKLEIVCSLSCDFIRERHWNWLSDNTFKTLDYVLSVGKNLTNISITDVSGINPLPLGNLSRLLISDLFYRGLNRHSQNIKHITAEAAIEDMIESTFRCVDNVIKNACVKSSIDWLQDSRLREKIFFELNQAINLKQLNIVFLYCQKVLLILEYTSVDMQIITLKDKLSSLLTTVEKIKLFIENLQEIQFMWMYLFYNVKFAIQGEIDRDTSRLYQSCTEDFKKVESILQSKGNNLYIASNIYESHEINTSLLRSNLLYLMEEVHSNVQSLLDACPRLSLLSYNRINLLIKATKLGANKQIEFISECMHDMFSGVGTLITSFHTGQRQYYCTGFASYDHVENIIFPVGILLSLPLPDFVDQLEQSIRMVLSKACDNLTLHRIDSLRSLLSDSSIYSIIENIKDIFLRRLDNIISLASNEIPNQSYLLVDTAWFCEDVWLCLGHPTGSIPLARPNIIAENNLFANNWKENLKELLNVCKSNISMIQDYLSKRWKSSTVLPMKANKIFAFLSSLLIFEISSLQTIDDILNCRCRESALEFWAGKYQLKFLYNIEDRVDNSPFDVTLGCLTVPYGLEYTGGRIRVVPNNEIENALQKMLTSSFSFRSTVLINQDRNPSNSTSIGDCPVSCKDLAAALGKIYITLISAENQYCVNFFLARVVYLNAVGCVDFTSIDHSSIQILVSSMNSFWSAIENKKDNYIQDCLKYPLKSTFIRSDLQIERQKSNLKKLRNNINEAKKVNKYCGMIVTGMASESRYLDITVFEYFSRSIFNTVAVNSSIPVRELGVLLSMQGFNFGMEIQCLFESTIILLQNKYEWASNLITNLYSSRVIIHLALKSGETQLIGLIDATSKLAGEIECFVAILWELVLNIEGNYFTNLIFSDDFIHDIFSIFQARLDSINISSIPSKLLKIYIGSLRLSPDPIIRTCIHKTSKELGLIADFEFVDHCAYLFHLLKKSNNCLVLLTGISGSGKSTIRDTVISMIKKIGVSQQDMRLKTPAINGFNAALVLLKFIRKWRIKRNDRIQNEKLNINSTETNETKNNNSANYFLNKAIVHTTVIYHCSLSVTSLLGSFDSFGRWTDGLLIRKIRDIDDDAQEKNKNKKFKKEDENALHVIILDGPLGFYIEQIFSSAPFLSSKSNITSDDITNSKLVFPSGELYTCPGRVKFLLETDDISQASPPLLAYTPHYHVTIKSELVAERLINVWIRSLHHWLANFVPWNDAYDEIKHILTNTNFIADILFYNENTTITPMFTISKLSSFLRYFEELLHVTHNLAVSDATFEDGDYYSDSSSSDEDESNDEAEKFVELETSHLNDDKFRKSIMTLNLKGREKLMARVQLSIIYAAIWGFGGHLNGSSQRNFFNNFLRDIIYKYLNDDNIDKENNLFDLVLDLEHITFEKGNFISPDQMIKGLPKKFEDFSTSAKLSKSPANELIFYTPSSKSVEQSIRLYLRSRGNMLVLGNSSSGKTRLINEILADLCLNTPTPSQLRNDIQDNLMDFITNDNNSSGVSSTLATYKQVLRCLETSPIIHDNQTNFTESWNIVSEGLKELRGNSNKNFDDKTIFASSNTLRSMNSASGLRQWLSRELATEVNFVLDTPRYSYGIVYIDDVHVGANVQSTSTGDMRYIQDQSGSLLKGLVDGTPAFGLKKNLFVRSELIKFEGNEDGLMERNNGPSPIMHREFQTDPRRRKNQPDNYIIERFGLICAANCDLSVLSNCSTYSQNIQHFGICSIPSMTIDELHVSLISGLRLCINQGSSVLTSIDDLMNEIVDLSNYTIDMFKMMVSSNDITFTSLLEKSIRSLIKCNVSTINHFCRSMISNSKEIVDPSSLLNSVIHEWRHTFIDPLPNGNQRSRIVILLRNGLNSINTLKWGISDDLLSNLCYILSDCHSNVCINTNLITGNKCDNSNNDNNQLVLLKIDNNDNSHIKITQDISGLNKLIILNESNKKYNTVLHPIALTMILKFVKIFSASNTNKNILLTGYYGTSRITAINLAAKICNLEFMNYNIKNIVNINSEKKLLLDFKLFLKTSVLKAIGFEVDLFDDSESSLNNIKYRSVPQVKIVIVLEGFQQISLENKILLLNLVKIDDPSNLFDNNEITGISKLLRKQIEEKYIKANQIFTHGSVDEKEVDQNIYFLQPPKPSLNEIPRNNIISSIEEELNIDSNEVIKEINDKDNKILLTGYDFHWVKKHLKVLIQENLSIVLDLEIRRLFEKTRSNMKINKKSKNNDLIYGENISILNCHILGPLIKDYFVPIWWDCESIECVHNICDLELTCQLPNKAISIISFKSDLMSLNKDNLSTDSSLIQDYYKFAIQGNFSSNLINYTGIIPEIGILKSFKSKSSCKADSNNKVKELITNALIEAKILLPLLLTIPTPCDNLFLSESILIPGIEKNTEIACGIVSQIIEVGYDVIFNRYEVLNSVLDGLNESNESMESIANISIEINTYIEELQKKRSQISKELQNVKNYYDTLIKKPYIFPGYEEYLITCGDFNSLRNEIHYIDKYKNNSYNNHFREVLKIDNSKWLLWSNLCSKEPTKGFIDVVRAIMIVVNYIPNNVTTNESDDEGFSVLIDDGIDDNDIVIYGVSFFATPDFNERFINFNPDLMSDLQFESIKIINSRMMSDTFNDDIGNVYPPLYEMDGFFNDTSIVPTFETVKMFFISIQVYFNLTKKIHVLNFKANVIKAECNIILERINIEINEKKAEYKYTMDHMSQIIIQLDTQNGKYRAKQLFLLTMEDAKKDNHSDIKQFYAYVEKELDQLNEILKQIVGDTCVLAAVVTRAAWLPEQIRQECMEVFRTALTNKKVIVSDTPFVLGCLLDRLQLRSWTNKIPGSLPRDPQSINCLSLAQLTPLYTYIVDPDGMSESVLSQSKSVNSKLFVCSGQKFQLALLKSWLHSTREENLKSPSMTIIITDIQAGVSDDLITFLSSEIVLDNYDNDIDIDGNRDNFTNKSSLYAEWYSVDSFKLSVNKTRINLLPFRLYLISTRGPSINHEGICLPLPTCCFKNIMIVHWSCSQSSYYIDSKPYNSSAEKNYTSEQFSINCYTNEFFGKISPEHNSIFEKNNENIINLTNQLYDVENNAVIAIYKWLKEEQPDTEKGFYIPDIIEHRAITLGITSIDRLVRLLATTSEARNYLYKELDYLKSSERELLSYETSINETFSMSIDFLRTCVTLLPSHLLPPYALAPHIICLKCFKNVFSTVQNDGLLKKIPDSLSSAFKLLTSIRVIQRFIRRKPWLKTILSIHNDVEKQLANIVLDGTDSKVAVINNNCEVIVNNKVLNQASQDNFSIIPINEPVLQSTSKSPFMHFLSPNNLINETEEVIVVKEKKYKSISIHGRDRLKCIKILNYFLLPCRSIFLTAAVDYVQISISTGLEWMVKFSLFVSTWSQSTILPVDELRTLSHLINYNTGHIDKAYNHLVSLKSINNIVTSINQNEDDDNFNPDTLDQDKLTINRHNSKYNRNSDQSNLYNRNINRKYTDMRTKLTLSDTSTNVQAALGWIHKGNGKIDGLWINKKSPRWQVCIPVGKNSADSNRWAKIVDESTNTRYYPTLGDIHTSKLTLRNALFRPAIRENDIFENEWQCLSCESPLPFLSSNNNNNRYTKVIDVRASKVISRKVSVRNNFNSHLVLTNKTSNRFSIKNPNGIERNGTLVNQSENKRMSTIIMEVNNSRQSSRDETSKDPNNPLVRTSRISQRLSIMTPRNSNMMSSNTRNSNMMPQNTRNSNMSRNSFLPTSPTHRIKSSKIENQSSDETTTTTTTSYNDVIDSNKFMNQFLQAKESKGFFNILENHSSLSKVFHGMTIKIIECMDDFLEWKEIVSSLSKLDFLEMDAKELEEIIIKIVPPDFINDDFEDNREENRNGCWVKGRELTILQTMIFSEVVIPGASGCIAEILFALLAKYFLNDGNIVSYKDESMDDEDEEDVQEEEISKKQLKLKNIKNDASDEDEDEEDLFDCHENSLGSINDEDDDNPVFIQEGVNLFNCWSKLRTIINGRLILKKPKLISNLFTSKVQLSLRNFYDWESVLYKVFTKRPEIEKFIFMNQLRHSVFNSTHKVFLANSFTVKLSPILSQRTRDICFHNNLSISIVNCYENLKSIQGKNQIQNVQDISKSISSTSKNTMIEMINISTSRGNAIMNITSATNSYSGEKVATIKKNLIVSSEWHGNFCKGQSPLLSLASLQFAWVPRLTVPDVISSVIKDKLCHSEQVTKDMPPSTIECIGMLCEEMESCLLWVLLTSRQIGVTVITEQLRLKLRSANKLELRVVSVLVTIWRLVLYLHGTEKVKNHCLEPLSLWQLTRTMIKTMDILQADWLKILKDKKLTIKELSNNFTFKKALSICSESFLSAIFHKSNKNEQNTEIIEAKSMTSSSSKVNISSFVYGVRSSGIVKNKSSIYSNNNTNNINNNSINKEPKVSRRRGKKNLIRLEMEQSIKKLQDCLQSVDKFGKFGSKLELFDPLLDKNTNIFSSSYQNVSNNISDNNSNPSSDILLRKRFLSMMSKFLSTIIVEYCHSNLVSVHEDDLLTSIAKDVKSRRVSSRNDISNFLNTNDPDKINDIDSEFLFEFDCDLSNNITIGGLMPNDIMRCMVKWTLDGSTKKSSEKAIERTKKFFSSIKKSALNMGNLKQNEIEKNKDSI